MRALGHLLRRLSRQPLVAASVVLGVALAVGLAVAAALATNALADLGLRATLQALPRASQNMQLTRTGAPFDQAFQRRIQRRLGDLIAGDYTVDYTPAGQARRETPLIVSPVRLRTQEGLLEHVTLQGRAPRPLPPARLRRAQPDCETFPTVEALLSAEQLAGTGFVVGDQLCVDGFLPVMIVGSFTANDPEEGYWYGDPRPIRGEFVEGELIAQLMLTPEDFAGIAPHFGEQRLTHIYRATTRIDGVNLDTLDAVDTRLRDLRTYINTLQPRPVLLTGIDRAIGTFNERFRLLQSALAPLLLGVVTLALLYLVLVGTLAIEQQSAEIAILRSRGGSRRQVMGYQAAQALGLIMPGSIAGLGLGALAALLIGRSDIFQRLRGGDLFPWRLTPANGLLVGAIVLLAFLGLILAARPALAMSLVTLREERARPPRRSGWRRLQVEGLLFLFAALAWWQLRRYGGELATLDGAARFNLLGLAAPILMMVGGAVLFLRLFPFAVRGLGRALARRRGLVGTLSAWQLARNPLLYGRLVLLLTLTVGLGIYSLVVTRTLEREQLRQALDVAGADLRLPLAPGADPAALLAAYPDATHTFLTLAEADIVRRSGDRVERQLGTALLAGVDGAALADVLDRSGSGDGDLLSRLRLMSAGGAMPPLGLPLPPAATALEVQLQGAGRAVKVYAKVAGLNGTRELLLGRPTAEWSILEAAIPPDLQAPLTLQSLIILPEESLADSSSQSTVFGALAARTPTARVVLADFGRPDDWEAVGAAPGDARAATVPGVAPGQNGIRLDYGRLPAGHWAALRFRVDATLPVYVSGETRGVRLNDGQTVPLRIDERLLDATVQGRIGRLPGVDAGRPVLLVGRERLAALLTYGLPVTLPPTELRLALPPGATAAAPDNAATREAALVMQAADPLGNGVRVILLLGFICALVLSLAGFVTYAALSLRARQLELAVLSALGLSSREILLLIAMEQGFVLGGGLVAGIAVGLLLAVATRPFLAIVTRGPATTPAFFDWPGLLLLAGGLLVALALALALLLANLRGRGLLRSLRLGEAQ